MTRFIALLGVAILGAPAWAQKLPPIFPIAEENVDGNIACNVLQEPLLNAAKAALRYNNVQTGSRDDALEANATILYINANSVTYGPGCAVSLNVSLRNIAPVYLSALAKSVTSTVLICDQGTLITGSVSTLQTRVNAQVKDDVDACITQLEELIAE